MDKNTNKQIANTILTQLGGGRAMFMLGAIPSCGSEPALYLTLKSPRMAKGIKYIVIKLDASDTYTVTASKVRKYVSTTVAEMAGVYADTLRGVIESMTGCYLSLGTMGR